MNEPRVLLTTDLIGGVWDFALSLARGLDAPVTLLALGHVSPAHRQAAEAAGAILLSAPLRLEWMQDADADVERTKALVETLVRELRPDVVHANQFAAACAPRTIPVVLTIHSDVLSWRRWTLGDASVPPRWESYRALVQAALLRADHVVAVSRFLAGEIADLYDFDGPIEVIHNGWEAGARGVRRTAAEPLTVLTGRAWDSAKNIPLAATAAGGWAPGRVVLAGDTEHPDTGVHMPIPPPVEQLGHLDRAALDTLLAGADIYLSPARYDPFGLLPLQAALAGCALLLSDLPSYRELWDGAARFFTPDDPLDLKRAWRDLIEQPGARAELAGVARERASRRLTSHAMANSYRALYGPTAAPRRVA